MPELRTCFRAALAIAALAGAGFTPSLHAEADEARAFIRFEVQVDAPAPFDTLIRGELDLIRWQGYETMTEELLGRLTLEAQAEIRELLAAQGHVRPEVMQSLETRNGMRVVRLAVKPGDPARIDGVTLTFTGAIAQGDGADRDAMVRARAAWALPRGAVFTQAAWSRAKARIVTQVSQRRYAGARITASDARIDPATLRATLAVTIDSGPVIRFGALQVFGLAKFDAARVRNLWTFPADSAFDRERLERFQRRLALLPYFANAYVSADPAKIEGDVIPVSVSVAEALTKGFDLGLKYSTDTGAGATFGYRDQNFLGQALRLRTRLDLQQRTQLAEAIVDLPEQPGGWADQLGTRLKHAEFENLRTEEWSLGWRRTAIEERRQPNFGLTFVQSDQRAGAALSESVHALYGYVGHTWRSTDDLLSPRRGLIAQLEAGLAPPGVSSRGFGRGLGRLAWFLPFGADRDLLLRAEAGAVLAPGAAGIPQYFLFRTGGGTSVRGYDPESLGVRRDSAVLGGRYYALASAEVTQWFNEYLGAAVFVDAGNAADRVGDLRPAWGIGAGIRARTPLGPFRLDLAYGEARNTLRLHFSIGLTF